MSPVAEKIKTQLKDLIEEYASCRYADGVAAGQAGALFPMSDETKAAKAAIDEYMTGMAIIGRLGKRKATA